MGQPWLISLWREGFDFRLILLTAGIMAIASLFALGNLSNMLFILGVQQSYTGSLAVVAHLLLYIRFNMVYALLAFPVGVWSDKIQSL